MTYTISAPGKLWKNMANLLLGMSMAAKVHGQKLNTVFANEEKIIFETNNPIYAREIEMHLSNYGLELNYDNKEVFRGFTKLQLDNAFDKVRNLQDWKAPIFAACPIADKEVVEAAIAFFTGTEANVEPISPTMCTVKSIGYRMGPCGP